MIIDLNQHDGGSLSADIVIVGTGACGLSMAERFLDTDAKVLLLETGGWERSAEAEAMNDAKVSGTLPVWIRTRSRFVGGSTNCWGGNNSPFDRVDFERDWIDNSTWPISLEDLEPYAAQVHELLHLGPPNFDVAFWKERLPRVRNGVLLEDSPRISTKLIQRTDVGHLGQLLASRLERSANVHTAIHAQVTNIVTNATGDEVDHLEVISLDGTRSVRVTATDYVLASGPENARLLLASNGVNPAGVGNDNGQVGRWWLAHHSSLKGWFEPADGVDWSLYKLDELGTGDRVFGALRTSDDVQRDEHLLNWAAILETFKPWNAFNNRARAIAAVKGALHKHSESLEPQPLNRELLLSTAADGGRVLARSVGEFSRSRKNKPPRALVRNWQEQAPHPDNRVELTGERDRFGVPKMKITSNMQPEDRATMVRSFEILSEELEKNHLGRLVADFPEKGPWPAGATSTAHFMGGTRMHADPAEGVVNDQCRMHGVFNLWVAGGSVFPSAGVSMITYTAVLLAARTAAAIGATQGETAAVEPGRSAQRPEAASSPSFDRANAHVSQRPNESPRGDKPRRAHGDSVFER